MFFGSVIPRISRNVLRGVEYEANSIWVLCGAAADRSRGARLRCTGFGARCHGLRTSALRKADCRYRVERACEQGSAKIITHSGIGCGLRRRGKYLPDKLRRLSWVA